MASDQPSHHHSTPSIRVSFIDASTLHWDLVNEGAEFRLVFRKSYGVYIDDYSCPTCKKEKLHLISRSLGKKPELVYFACQWCGEEFTKPLVRGGFDSDAAYVRLEP